MAHDAPEEPMEWQVDLGSDRKDKRMVVAALAFLAGAAGLLLVRSPIFAVLGPVIVIGATLELWVPIKYRIDEEKATSRAGWNVTEIRWENVRRVDAGPGGVQLSPFVEPSRLDAFRGVFLRFVGNQEAVEAKIRALRGIDGRVVAGRPDAGKGSGDD